MRLINASYCWNDVLSKGVASSSLALRIEVKTAIVRLVSMMRTFHVLFLTCVLINHVSSFHNFGYGFCRRSFSKLDALKFDPANFIKVSIQKPLGLSLEEVEENKKRGVTISEIDDGNAKASGKLKRGAHICC